MARPQSDGRAPGKPTELEKSSWSGVLKRTVREFKEDDLADRAAALTYYGILAIFPAILALVSVLGLVGASATQPLIDNLGKVAPGPAKDIFTGIVDDLEGAAWGRRHVDRCGWRTTMKRSLANDLGPTL